jgi:uncharacterized protein HemX
MDTTQVPNMNPAPTPTPAPTDNSSSAVAIIIVILIIALGGAYFWYSRAQINKQKAAPQPNTVQNANIPNEVLRNDLQETFDINIDEDLKGLDEIYIN